MIELTRLQTTVARRMAEAKATIPHFYLSMEIDMTEGVKLRARLKEVAAEGQAVPTFNDMVVKACARALRDFPRANGSYRDGHVEQYSRVNVGVAVAAQDALVVPTIFDVDVKSLGEIAARSRELARRCARGRSLPPSCRAAHSRSPTWECSGSRLLGRHQPPAGGDPGGGRPASRRRSSTDTRRVAVRDMMGVTLACDHRILYGADGARFLGRVRDLLQQPLALAL